MKIFCLSRVQILGRIIEATVLTLLLPSQLAAQITPDATLPDASRVARDRNQSIITGGTQAGQNLFHSLREFSVPRGEVASFQGINPQTENIFTRITGSSVSRINGMIEALQEDSSLSSANFFLINPNGIIFGPNASLNIGGSFLSTTADRINFADGTSFDAVNPQAEPLLSLSVPVGIQFGHDPARIINRSLTEAPDGSLIGLAVPSDQTIALVGGEILIQGGELTAPGGRIELGSMGGPGQVQLRVIERGWRLVYQPEQNFEDVALSEQADLDASGVGGGTIRLRGNRILITDESLVRASTSGDQNGNGIFINATQLILRNGGQIEANTSSSGNAGDIVISTSDALLLEDVYRDEKGTPFVDEKGSPFSSGLFARVLSRATGQGGDIIISTDTLRLTGGAQIGAETFGAGRGGNLAVRAVEIELIGVVRSSNDEALQSTSGGTFPSAMSTFNTPLDEDNNPTDSYEGGRAGNLSIDTQRLSLQDGATLQTSTQGNGNAGNLTIQAIERVEVVGTAPGLAVPTGILTFSGGVPETELLALNPDATGAAGNLRITTGSLIVRDGAIIALGSVNPNLDQTGRAGNLQIEADSFLLDNAALLSNTNSGQGGTVNLQIADALSLDQSSKISTTAGTARQGGNGGNIEVRSNFVISSPASNNDITANAFTGNGGNINITTQGIFGINPQEQLTPQSDITASSERGISGQIQISTLDLDPSRGLTELPSDVVDAANQVNQVCPTGNAAAREPSEFVVTGRGGLPANPEDALNGETLLADWVTLSEPSTPVVLEPEPIPEPSAPLVEAQGWRRGANGEVIFTAQAAAPSSSNLYIPHCP